MWDYPENYDGFYGEPSEFEEQVEEFKDSLRKSISHEWIDRMNALEKENAELQEVKKNFEAVKMEYEEKKRECEMEKNRAINDAEYNARHTRLKTLMKGLEYEFWDVGYEYKYGPKCNKCNGNRQIPYKTPSGMQCYEDCSCAEKIKVLEPRRQILYQFELINRNDKTVLAWYRACKGDSDDYYTCAACFNNKIVVEDDADFAKLNPDDIYTFYFRSYDKCKEFCDWYNSDVKKIDIKCLTDKK